MDIVERQRNKQFDRAEDAECQLADAQMALEEAQEKLEAVEAEIHMVTDYNRKTCEHAVCGLARRIDRILSKERSE